MSKYTRTITQTINGEDRGFTIEVDVYDVLRAFEVTDPAVQHAVKKLLCSGSRGHKDKKQDLQEAVQSIERAIDVIKAEEVFEDPLAVEFKCPPNAAKEDDDEYAGEPLGTEADNTPQWSDCPFAVGDVIQAGQRAEAVAWLVTQVCGDHIDTTSYDLFCIPGYIARQFWPNFKVIAKAALDKPDQTC